MIFLELLTWGKRFEDQDLTSTGFGNQTVSVLGSLLENQLEKNLKDSEFGKLGWWMILLYRVLPDLLQGADEDFEVTPKKKSGLLTLPITKAGKLIMVGSVMALVLTGGGLYFAWKTFAPDEFDKNAKITETEREAASEADLSRSPGDFLNEDMTSEMTKSAGSSPGSEGTVPSPNATKLTLSTIMPVVFNTTNVRELSFNLEIETTDQFSAEAVRKATPVYEKIMVATIESFLRNKSYNDILDINEKLQQRLQNNINQK